MQDENVPNQRPAAASLAAADLKQAASSLHKPMINDKKRFSSFRSSDDPRATTDIAVSFPVNCSMALDAEEASATTRTLTKLEAEIWSSSHAAKFAAGRYLRKCRQVGVISRRLMVPSGETFQLPTSSNKRKKLMPVTVPTSKKKPPTMPIPTLKQAKKHVASKSENEHCSASSLERQAKDFQAIWQQVREGGPFAPGWTASGELVADTNMLSCTDLLQWLTRPPSKSQQKPRLMDDPASSYSDSTVQVLKALLDLMTPHPALYNQPLVVTKVQMIPIQSGKAFQLKIAVYANRLLWECMTQELRVVLNALDLSSYQVERSLQVPPSQTLRSNTFCSAEFPQVITDPHNYNEDTALEHASLESTSGTTTQQAIDVDAIVVDGSTRCDEKTLDAFTIPGLMKLVENTGTFDEKLWKTTIAPPLESALKVPLLLHQQHGVCWMHQMERLGNLNHLVWECRRFAEGDTYYYSPALGQLRLTLSHDEPALLHGKPFGGGGVLCDEMGLGKTCMTLALVVSTLEDIKRHMMVQKEAAKKSDDDDPSFYRHATLIVVPPALLNQWVSEIHKISPDLVVDTLVHNVTDLDRVQQPESIDLGREADIILTTYTALEDNAKLKGKNQYRYPDALILAEQVWGRIVLDEMQEIRSWTTRISKLVNSLVSDCRWMLSGTPLLEDVNDLKGELCFLGLEPFSATNEDGYFQFAVANHWEHKSPYGLTILRKLAELVMLRRSKSMTIKESGMPLLGLKPFTLTYEPVPQDDSERALYCFLEYLMHSTMSITTQFVLDEEKDDHKKEMEAKKKMQELSKNKVAFLRMLRELCLSPSLLNGGLGCPSQLETLNRWMKEFNRKLHNEMLQKSINRTDRQNSRTKLRTSEEKEKSAQILSCDEAIRFLSQVEDLARTDQDFVTDVRVGGGAGISNRKRAVESLDEKYASLMKDYTRSKDLCVSASQSRAKANWHFALEAVTTGHLFVGDSEAYARVHPRIRNLWRWRSCSRKYTVFRGWRPTKKFFGRSVSQGRDAAMMSLYDRHPKFYWAHPYSVVLADIPSTVTKDEVSTSIATCLLASPTESVFVKLPVVELTSPITGGTWKGFVIFSSTDQYAFFLKKAKSPGGIHLKCKNGVIILESKIKEAKEKLDECAAGCRVHPSSVAMQDLTKARREYKATQDGLRIFTYDKKRESHVYCIKSLGPIRTALPCTSEALFRSTTRAITTARDVLSEHGALTRQKETLMAQLKEKITAGVTNNSIGQLTTVEALRALKEGKTDQTLCPICFDNLGHDMSLVTLTRCGHMSCKGCMLNWINEKSSRGQVASCIECRKRVLRDQLVTVDPRKTDDEEELERQRESAKSLVQEAAAMLDSNKGQLPPHLWEALYLAIDPPKGVGHLSHNRLTAIPSLVLAHIRNATGMTADCSKTEPKNGGEFSLSSKVRALLSDLPRDDVSVVFASSKIAVLHLMSVFSRHNIGCRGLFTGQTDSDSKTAVHDWHELPNVLVLVVQAGVAACGLTLTKASRMFLMGPFLKHEEEKQAYARLHRYGQERAVSCKVYYTPVSVEERLLAWRHHFESEGNATPTDTTEKTVFAPLRGVEWDDEDDEDPSDDVGAKQTSFLLGLFRGKSS